MGCIRLHVALDCTGYSLESFIDDNIEPSAMIATDSCLAMQSLTKSCLTREKNQNIGRKFENLIGVHLLTTLIKRLIRGTYNGRFEPKYLYNYLDEYVFRFNRRKSKNIGKKFMLIVQKTVRSSQIT